jgi:SulP family sulfate permease
MRDKGSGDQHVLYRLWLTLTHGDPVNVRALAVSAATVVLALLARKIVQRYRLPQMDMLLVLILVGAFAYYAGWTLPGAGGKTTVAVAGAVPASLPPFHIPEIKLAWIGKLSSGALAVAFLGLIEALAIAKSIANQTRQRLDYNRQCLAEGIANLAGGFFQCLPGSGSLSRSAINFQAGAVTRFSGIVTSVTVALAVLVFAPLTQFIPKPALAGLLLITALRLIDVGRIGYALRASRYDAGLVIITALSALLIGVDASVLIGFALSVLLFVPRAAKLKASELVVSPERVVRERLPSDPPCTAFILYDLEGELFFGAAPELERYFSEIDVRVRTLGIRYVVLRLKRVRNPDVVCLERFEHFLRDAEKHGVVVLLAGARPDFLQAIQRLHFGDWLPADRIFPQQDDEDSATLAAVRFVYRSLGTANACNHCKRAREAAAAPDALYYRV